MVLKRDKKRIVVHELFFHNPEQRSNWFCVFCINEECKISAETRTMISHCSGYKAAQTEARSEEDWMLSYFNQPVTHAYAASITSTS
jgi:hypothetical protein